MRDDVHHVQVGVHPGRRVTYAVVLFVLLGQIIEELGKEVIKCFESRQVEGILVLGRRGCCPQVAPHIVVSDLSKEHDALQHEQE